MVLDLDLIAAAVFGAAATAVFSHYFNVRRSRSSEGRSRNTAAAAELITPLRTFQAMVRRHGRTPLLAREVGEVVSQWGRAFDAHHHRLPTGTSHIYRSALDAVGTVFGAVAFAHIRPETAEHPLEDPHGMWQDYADDYLDYLAVTLARWGDGTSGDRSQTYGDWLVLTGRRKPVGQNGPDDRAASAVSPD